MAYRLVGQDCSVTLNLGGAWDGTPNWQGAVSVKGLARSVRISDTIDTHDVSGLGDAARALRPKRQSYRCELELYVSSTGMVAASRGDFAQLVVNELSGLGTNHTFTGIVTEVSLDIPDGPQVQRIVIEGPAEVSS